jgi:hypothetical protein
MADVTGGTPPTNASPFAVPADMTDIYDHFGGLDKYSVATSASLPGSGNWEGRQLFVTDQGRVRTWSGSSWGPVKRMYFKDFTDAAYVNLATIGTIATISAMPIATRIRVQAVGMIGFSGTPDANYGLNVTSSGGTLTDPAGNEQTQCLDDAEWYSYSREVWVDLPASTATTIAISMSTPSTAGHWKGIGTAQVFLPGEY